MQVLTGSWNVYKKFDLSDASPSLLFCSCKKRRLLESDTLDILKHLKHPSAQSIYWRNKAIESCLGIYPIMASRHNIQYAAAPTNRETGVDASPGLQRAIDYMTDAAGERFWQAVERLGIEHRTWVHSWENRGHLRLCSTSGPDRTYPSPPGQSTFIRSQDAVALYNMLQSKELRDIVWTFYDRPWPYSAYPASWTELFHFRTLCFSVQPQPNGSSSNACE